MRKIVLTLSLGFALTACADHAGSIVANADGPKAPINQPDTKVTDPGSGSPSTNTPSEPGNNGGGTGGGAGSGGGNPGGGNPGGGTGGGPGGGSGGGSPVPEPGTLLLVGTGLAGAALLRRRRQRPTPQA